MGGAADDNEQGPVPASSPDTGQAASEDPRSAMERRATVRLARYWTTLRRSEAMPLFRDFDPRRNPVPWENCFLSRREAGAGVVFDHIGSALWIALDRPSPVTRPVGQLPAFLAVLASRTEAALASGVPAEESDILALGAGARLLFRSVLLPFADADGAPRYALGAVTFRVDRGVPAVGGSTP